ncbi:hypothetical protein [Flavobacterium sp. H122]|uniref:hypothetical protein n=1 Tax=Flavobacterium sp. H122 TaxID=2529860 RepID=UPI0010AB327F|nr:hypothetical protein [Flavobacterium sp. H122]
MKTKILSISLLLSLLFTSCDVVDNLFTFYISDEASFSVNSGLPVNSPFDAPTPDVTTNSTAEFENNNTNANLVKDVKLKELQLAITSPADKTFSFLKEIHIYISTDDTDEIELAYLTNINTTANTLYLICTSAKLDKYIKASSYKLRTQITTKETLMQKVDFKANMKFRITADPL